MNISDDKGVYPTFIHNPKIKFYDPNRLLEEYNSICKNEGEEPEIKLIANSPKKYIKRYRLKIISYDIEMQLTLNEKNIRETLLKDLSIHKGLKENTLFNIILIHEQTKDNITTTYI